MLESNGLTVSVSETGIFIHFVASDGSETQIVLDVSNAMTNRALVNWCHERLEEVTPNEVLNERRWSLLTTLDEIAAVKETELGQAKAAGASLETEDGAPEAAPGEWLERAEQALDASAVLLTKEAFKALLMLAKRGASEPASSREALTN